jgi:hypothetical protein
MERFKLLQSQYFLAAHGQLHGRGRPHAAKANHNDIKDFIHEKSPWEHHGLA